MIPPCDPSILEHNPQFKRLYENLVNNVLNADGSTRANANPVREAVVEDLKQCQISASKKRIKEWTLKKLTFATDSELHDECHDNLALISIYLETPSTAIEGDTLQGNTEGDRGNESKEDDALALLSQEFETFYSHIPKFILQYSNILSTSLNDLRTISSISADPSATTEPEPIASRTLPGLTRSTSNHYARARARDRRVRTSMAPVPPLSSQLRSQVQTLRRIQESDLPAARRQMAATAAEVLAVQAQILERTVAILERAKHGALARATRAKAEHLAIVAQGIEGKLEATRLEIAATLYTPETLAALTRYKQHLHEVRARLEQRREIAIEELTRYGDDVSSSESGDTQRNRGLEGNTLSEIARRYGALAKEVEDVKMEIARLGE